MSRLPALLACCGALLLPTLAHADTFSFSASGAGGGFSGTGTIDATNEGSYYQINSISGGNAQTGLTVLGLVGVNGYDGNDNELFPNQSSLVDGNGFAFTASQVNPNNQGDTSYTVRLYSSNDQYFLDLTDSDGYKNGAIPANFSIAAQTPEPASLMLLGSGALGLFGVVRRKFKSA